VAHRPHRAAVMKVVEAVTATGAEVGVDLVQMEAVQTGRATVRRLMAG
jgi:hypothetical protein